jgi:hypothetical protein
MEQMTIESAKAFLESKGYYTRNMWHVMDVEGDYTDEEKLEIIDSALTNEGTIEYIFGAISLRLTDED